jgi:hypothetical protein
MMIRGKTLLAIAALVAAGLSSACASEATQAKDKSDNEPSGQVVVHERVWYPWRFEPMAWEHNAWVHYRQHEEKAAAKQLRRTESWLKFAASHALPESRKALETAVSDLDSVAKDLEEGKVVKADRLGYALARADHSLAEWHYFKAREGIGRSEEMDAAVHLRTAARYLEHAATSARDEYGPETASLFQDIDEYGNVIDEGVTTEPSQLATHLDALERELKKMGKTLDEAAERYVAD